MESAMPKFLPPEFKLGHDLAFVLHDLLAEHIVEGERAGLLWFEVPLNRPEDAKTMEGLQGEDFWHWCEANGYRHILDQYSYRNLIFGLLSDMCHFLYEGLKCSEKAKLSVAFSNFRKPLQDNLFYLEWILADWPGFLARFQQGPEHIDPSKLEKDIKKTTRVDFIEKAMDKTPMGRWIDPEWLYELRYEKASDFGLDPVFNHALHLVTTFKRYATSPENINFIFCNDDDREDLWRCLYLLLPPVLIHALYVVRALFKTIAPEFEPHDALTDLWLTAGLLLWAEGLGRDDRRAAVTAVFKDILPEVALDCPQCRTRLDFGLENMRSFWDRGEVRCSKCQIVLPLLEPSNVGDDKHHLSVP
jgi:hypothetical protein